MEKQCHNENDVCPLVFCFCKNINGLFLETQQYTKLNFYRFCKNLLTNVLKLFEIVPTHKTKNNMNICQSVEIKSSTSENFIILPIIRAFKVDFYNYFYLTKVIKFHTIFNIY